MELLNGESIIWAGHPTWRAMLSFHIKGLLITLAAVIVLILINAAGVNIATGLMIVVAAIGVAVTVFSGWVMRFFTEYAITNKRLHIRRGILTKNENSANVDRIQNITTHQSFVDRILRVGTLDFDTAGEQESDRFRFAGVNHPQDLREKIMSAQDADTTASRQGGLG